MAQDEGADDVWDFLPKRTSESTSPALEVPVSNKSETKSTDDPWDFLATRKAEVQARGDEAIVPEVVIERREHGEFRSEMGGASLKRRAIPMAVALAAIFFAGFVTEVVASSQMIALAGTQSLLYIYPLGGLGLILLGLAQFRFVDQAARLRVLRYVSLAYALVFVVALVFISAGITPIIATGLIWLLADQLNFLVPLLIWSLAGDEFNVAEGQKIFGWLVAWTYVGQFLGLGVAFVSPSILKNLDVSLTSLLIISPIVCVGIAIWLPRVLRGSHAAQGTAKAESYPESFKSAWGFITGVPIWRYLLSASMLSFVGGTTIVMGFSVGAGDIIGRDAQELQVLFAGAWLIGLAGCLAIQYFFAERIAAKIGIPGTLILLPIAAVIAGIVMTVGAAMGSVAIIIVAITVWRLPRWSLDENARRGALALVPDERRTRVSFIIDLLPVATGLIMAAPIVAVGFVFDRFWISSIIATLIAVAAIPLSIKVIKGWEDSLMNWRLRRRKQNRTLDFG